MARKDLRKRIKKPHEKRMRYVGDHSTVGERTGVWVYVYECLDVK